MGVELETKDSGPGAPADELSFLIADVRGYTSFTRERGDAEAARLATRFAALAGDAVAARSGEVVEVRGDEVFAVFRSASQAVRAATELQATLAEESAADPSLPLPAGIGIATGKAVRVGDGFRGTALNLAARLCSRAAAGQVLVAAEVVEQVGDVEVGRLEELGQEALKGFDEPVSVYEAVVAAGRLESPPRSAPEQDLPVELLSQTPLVGRQPELAWPRGTWRSARRGHGRIVFVSALHRPSCWRGAVGMPMPGSSDDWSPEMPGRRTASTTKATGSLTCRGARPRQIRRSDGHSARGARLLRAHGDLVVRVRICDRLASIPAVSHRVPV